MKALALVAVLVLAAGCGSERTGSAPAEGGPSSSAAEPEPGPDPTTSDSDPDSAEPPEPPEPPEIVLRGAAGEQLAERGSFCITDAAQGVGLCTDTEGPGEPERLSVVRPGEEVLIVVVGADDAEGSVGVRQAGCPDQLALFPLTGPERPWTVDLDPGVYALDVFATFEAGTATGDTSGVLGLSVSTAGAQEIVDAPATFRRCP